ncbi:hypothetical protein [Methylobacterium sp. J-076]|uniref:hypothetical protein n=1 Tax=Methylobacterium sp. J-076 TaxID=2836655 RepID=UPI001FBB5721|nr:hypothetical protein [Methylobacterium sp. J-076]MCJ2011005.1 hypothetical protein [Methylobacterium sp. J-076]
MRGIRTDAETGTGMECDAHPDPVAEACRWQICEGELLQAIGQARGVNGTAETPLAIDVLANVCLRLIPERSLMRMAHCSAQRSLTGRRQNI